MDHESYRFLRDWLTQRRQPETDDERAFMSQLRAAAPALDAETIRYHLPPDGEWAPPCYANATVLEAPTVVDLQLTQRCHMGCPHCYMSSSPSGHDMPWEQAKAVVEAAAEMGVCQIAIGGGEPLLHPHFAELLYHTRAFGVMPNLTTTGDGLTPRILRAMSDCCGAVALSLEGVYEDYDRRRKRGFAFFRETHDAFRSYGIPTVFQIALSAENLSSLPDMVDYCLACDDLYGVLFLAYKSIGRGEGFQTPLSQVRSSELFPLLRDAFQKLSAVTRVGYDCCLTPGIVGMDRAFGYDDPGVVEGCSAVRTSVGVTVELDVVPCTFLTHHVLGNLREQTLREVWQGERAAAFRARLDGLDEEQTECRDCVSRKACLGGCPEWDLVRCHARSR
jgi:radical SAM protein with 4Fe4S-binding SPASM domain